MFSKVTVPFLIVYPYMSTHNHNRKITAFIDKPLKTRGSAKVKTHNGYNVILICNVRSRLQNLLTL